MVKTLKANYPKAYKELKANGINFHEYLVSCGNNILILQNKKSLRTTMFDIIEMGWK